MSRLLVIDDDPTITQMCKAYFTVKGHQVATAVNGRDGLAKFSAGEFDLVITDLMMPQVHGFRVIDDIKSSDRGDDVPVILLSADKDDPELRAYRRKKYQDETISKPFDIPALERMVNRLLEKFADKKAE
jgi:two-component system chemotaxis response regulator CheY